VASYAALGIPDPLAAIARICAHRRFRPRARTAMILLLEGARYREAARAAGLADHADLYRKARRYDVDRLHRVSRGERERIARASATAQTLELSGEPSAAGADAVGQSLFSRAS
jgi:hypothetical protein